MTADTKRLTILALVVALGIHLLLPALVRAGGIGIAPVEIQLDDALRGSEYLRTVTFMNQEDSDISFQVFAEGETASWVSLHQPGDLATNTKTVDVPAQTDLRLTLRIVVPDDAANGPHDGSIRFQAVALNPKEGESGMGVSIGIASKLKVGVSGAQKLSGTVLDLSAVSVEADQPPFRIKTSFKNDGNVKAKPVIKLLVRNEQNLLVGEASYDATTVDADHIEVIQSEWDHSGKPVGRYTATVVVALGDLQIGRRELQFEILPRGTLTRSGVLDKLTLDSRPQVGAMAKLTGLFRNTGKIDTRAILTAEIYRDSVLMKVVESRERMVPVGEMAAIDLFFDVPSTGEYNITGKVSYEGKETALKELSFTAASTGPEFLSITFWPIGVSVGGVVAVGVAIWLAQRRKKSTLWQTW